MPGMRCSQRLSTRRRSVALGWSAVIRPDSWPELAKSERCRRTTQKRWPVGASMTHQVRTCAMRLAPSLLQAPHFRLDVVGLDVQMNPAGMIDLLHFDVQIVAGCIEQLVGRSRPAGCFSG